MYKWKCKHICLYTCMYLGIRVYTYLCISICVYVCACVCTYLCLYSYLYMIPVPIPPPIPIHLEHAHLCYLPIFKSSCTSIIPGRSLWLWPCAAPLSSRPNRHYLHDYRRQPSPSSIVLLLGSFMRRARAMAGTSAIRLKFCRWRPPGYSTSNASMLFL